jgi:exosortase A
LAVLAFVWLLGNLGEVKLVQELAVVAMLVTLVWTLLGTAMVRALRFPLIFLFFSVPFGISLIRPLQDFTGWFAVHALTLSQVPVVMENHTLFLPTGEWTVAEACSGIRFLLSSVVVGAIFASIAYRSWKRRSLFLAASIVVPIIANGLRAYGIILLAYLTDNKVATGVDHIVYGEIFAVFIQLVLVVVGLRWREKCTLEDPVIPGDTVTDPRLNDHRPAYRGPLVLTGASLLLVCLTPPTASRLWNRASAAEEWGDPPVVVTAPWKAEEATDDSWALHRRDPDRIFSRSFTNEKNRIDLYWTLHSGRRGLDLAMTYSPVDSPNPWILAADGLVSAPVEGRHATIRRSLIESGQDSRVVWAWYRVGGEYTANPARVRFLQAKARLLGGSSSVVAISLGANSQPDLADSERALQEFLRHVSFQITGHSPQGRLASTSREDETSDAQSRQTSSQQN